jgi:hypothetical protein
VSADGLWAGRPGEESGEESGSGDEAGEERRPETAGELSLAPETKASGLPRLVDVSVREMPMSLT